MSHLLKRNELIKLCFLITLSAIMGCYMYYYLLYTKLYLNAGWIFDKIGSYKEICLAWISDKKTPNLLQRIIKWIEGGKPPWKSSALETFFPGTPSICVEALLDVISYFWKTATKYLTTYYVFFLNICTFSSAVVTCLFLLLFFILYLLTFYKILTPFTSGNKYPTLFFGFLQWAFNYMTANPFKIVWGFMFRFLFLILAGFIFLSNLLGLISISFISTSYLSVTLALSLVAFLSFNVQSIVFFGTFWLCIFLPSKILLLTAYAVVGLELVSYSLRVISLSVRLFANITAGHLLLNVLSGILWTLLTHTATVVLSIVWGPFMMVLLIVSAIEVFISFLQGFVYLILLKIYNDDSLNVIVKKQQTMRDAAAIQDIKNIEKKSTNFMIYSIYLAAETKKVNKQNTKKTKTIKEQTTKNQKIKDPIKVTKQKPETIKIKLPKINVKKKTAAHDSKKLYIRNQNAPLKNYGMVSRVDGGIIYITGLYDLSIGEIVYFGRNMEQAITLNLERNVAKAAIFGVNGDVAQGTPVFRTFRLMKVSINSKLLGKVVDCLGNILSEENVLSDNKSTISRTVDIKALGVIDRKSINEPMVTGVLSIDSMLPIGRGQRELIIGDRQLGKTSLAIDSIISQKNLHVSNWRVLSPIYCIYVAVGQKLSNLARLASQLKQKNALHYTIIVSASAAESAAMQYLVPYVGCAIAEWFLSRNGHTLIVYDDLGIQATAYRQLSLLLRRPPGREAYPGDIFYLHSRLLERAAKVNEKNGLGSITALPIVETKDGDLSAYIPTNVISITDGQVFLSAAIFYKDIKPAISFTKSVSRVGSKAQTKSIKRLVGLLKRLLALYEDLKYYETLDTGELNEAIKSVLNAGHHLMTIFKQKRFRPYMLQEQFILIWAAIMSFNHVSRESSAEFKTFLVRSIAFDSWAIYKLLNVGVNKMTNTTDVFILLNIYYWERCIIYNLKAKQQF